MRMGVTRNAERAQIQLNSKQQSGTTPSSEQYIPSLPLILKKDKKQIARLIIQTKKERKYVYQEIKAADTNSKMI